MLLTELSKIARVGSRTPLLFWLAEYQRIRSAILPQFNTISDQLHQTKTHEQWRQLLDCLRQNNPNEELLAKSLQNIIQIVDNTITLERPAILNTLLTDTSAFVHLAQKTAAAYERSRRLRMSAAQQREHDVELFRKEGMFYSLEYYLELYKHIVDAPSLEQKRIYIEQKEIKLEFGRVPGLWYDFFDFEVLDKFIYQVYNDALREELAAAYFSTRNDFLAIGHQFENASVQFSYQHMSIDALVYSLKRFIMTMMQHFQAIGIDRLSSTFYVPYGNQPRITEIQL